MSVSTVPDPAKPHAIPAVAEDLTGRGRLLWNVLTSWAGHLVFIIAGFILPRMVNDRLGSHTLGVWDFTWSIVTYFALVQGGVVSSINRFVALHRAAGDQDAINRSVSSVSLVLLGMAGIIVALAVAVALLLPMIWGQSLGSDVRDAQWVIMLLGASLALQTAYSGYGGVVTGCHRWDLHNAVHAGTYVVTTIGMIVAMLLGGGLVAMAVVTLACEFVGRALRVSMAYRVCPGLVIDRRLAEWPVARRMLGFGVKTYVPAIGELLLNQTIALLIVTYLGPVALAIFSRPKALVRHAATLVTKFAHVLVPTASSLSSTTNPEQIRELALRTTQFGSLMAMPIILVLALLGGPLLEVWMGPGFRVEAVAATLALGHLASIVHQPLVSILSGLNLHGTPGLASFCASIATVFITWAVLGWSGAPLEAAALAAVLPIAVVELGFTANFACRRLNIAYGDYLSRVWLKPLLCNLPLIAAILLAREFVSGPAWLQLVTALAVGGLATMFVYWRWALPVSLKRRLLSKLRPHHAPHRPVDETT